MYRVVGAHEEGGERVFSVSTERFVGDGEGRVRALRAQRGRCWSTAGSSRCRARDRELPCDLVLLAMGFTGAERAAARSGSASSWTPAATSRGTRPGGPTQPGVFVCGDMGRGQSLIVWAIAEGRACAAAVDRDLTGDTLLPEPLAPTAALKAAR